MPVHLFNAKRDAAGSMGNSSARMFLHRCIMQGYSLLNYLQYFVGAYICAALFSVLVIIRVKLLKTRCPAY